MNSGALTVQAKRDVAVAAGGALADLNVQVPHSVAAEQALLGILMVNNRLLDELGGTLLSAHFYVPLHATIFDAVEGLVNRGREANPITVRERLRGTPYDDDATLLPHLSSMFENAGMTQDVKSLAEVIHTTYLQRQLMSLGEALRSQAGGAHKTEDVKTVLETASGELFTLAETGTSTATAQGLRKPLLEVIKRAEQAKKDGSGITGVATNFADLDNLLGGLQRSDLVILAARPSMGKTAFSLNIAQHAAERLARGEQGGAAVGFFSLEMSSDQLATRMLAGAAGVASHKISSGMLSSGDFQRLADSAGKLAELPLYVDDTPGLSINALRARARRMKRQYGIGLLVVDYLQLMSAPGNEQNRVQEVSQISQGLKHIARELNVPVIALSQLSRSVENRDNKRPQLADLRESGSIEQDADVVMFLYREEYYLQRQLGASGELDPQDKKVQEIQQRLQRTQGITELIVSKNRKGPTNTVKLTFHGETTTFHSYAGPHFETEAA